MVIGNIIIKLDELHNILGVSLYSRRHDQYAGILMESEVSAVGITEELVLLLVLHMATGLNVDKTHVSDRVHPIVWKELAIIIVLALLVDFQESVA